MNLTSIDPDLAEDGRVIDYITGDLLENKPEELVRQRLQRLLHLQFGYPKDRIGREVPIYYGGTPVTDAEGRPVRADVAVFKSSAARQQRDQGNIDVICETKRPNRKDGYGQLVSYICDSPPLSDSGGGINYAARTGA